MSQQHHKKMIDETMDFRSCFGEYWGGLHSLNIFGSDRISFFRGSRKRRGAGEKNCEKRQHPKKLILKLIFSTFSIKLFFLTDL